MLSGKGLTIFLHLGREKELQRQGGSFSYLEVKVGRIEDPSRVTRKLSSRKSETEYQVLKESNCLGLFSGNKCPAYHLRESHAVWAGGKFGDQCKDNLFTYGKPEQWRPKRGAIFLRSQSMLPLSSVCFGEFLPICMYYRVPWDKLFLAYLSTVLNIHNEMFSFT